MVWLVSGGRKFANTSFVFNNLDRVADQYGMPELVIHGNAPGTDTLADLWAQSVGVPTEKVSADWDQYGPSAGPIRNSAMLDKEPDLAIFFPGGPGTMDMYRKTQAAGIQTIAFNQESFI